jgi:phosphopantothenate-cysteine ligase
METGMLLLVDFLTIDEYLFLLRDLSVELGQGMGERAMWYLAAAVSDFHVPPAKLVEHKIQSGQGEFAMRMVQVPNVLKPLVH